MKIKSIVINDILSIESAEVNFDESGLVLVEGWNHDVGRANGAGKTAIFNAMSFAIYDKIPRKITASEIVRRGCRTGSTVCTVEVGDDTWVVSRTRPKGVVFTKNGEVVNISQEEWEKNIRLNYNQFLISVYCAQRGDNRFLGLNDSGKKDFLLQLLDLDKFHDLKKMSDDKAKSIGVEISDILLNISNMKSKVSAYKESLINEDEVRQIIAVLEQEIGAFKAKINNLKSIKRPDMSNYVDFENQIASKEKAFATARTSKTLLHGQYRKLISRQSDFEMSNSCNLCGSELDLTNAKKHHEEEQKKLSLEINDIKEQIDIFDATLSKEHEVSAFRTKLAEKKRKELEQYELAQDSINELNLVLVRRTGLLENAVLKLSRNDDYLNKINDITALTVKLENKHSRKIKDLEFYKTLSAIYSPTGAQAYILDSIIDSFNEVVGNYIELVWPTATYQLNSFKETSKGDITAKFSESLMIDGKDVSIGSLSGGEMRAISLCVDFAIMDVMQSNFGIKINPTILDEPFDGLDSVGKEIVIGLLEKISNDRQIIVVDHSSEAKAMFTKVISVELRNKVSTIKVDF